MQLNALDFMQAKASSLGGKKTNKSLNRHSIESSLAKNVRANRSEKGLLFIFKLIDSHAVVIQMIHAPHILLVNDLLK